MTITESPIYIIDAFTDKMFGGNPAAVCPLTSWPGDAMLQAVASENNLSETAFFVKTGEVFELRWFTPTVEVDLCGHATLASAYVLFEHMGYDRLQITFETKSGALMVTKEEEMLIMDFPALSTTPVEVPDLLSSCLGREPIEVLVGSWYYLALFENEDTIRTLNPDFTEMVQLGREIIVTAEGNGTVDFVSRFFGPGVGIPEDPVTGSAHSALVPYWAKKLEKTTFHALQVSARGGELFCKYKDDRVIIGGKAVTYSKGSIMLPL